MVEWNPCPNFEFPPPSSRLERLTGKGLHQACCLLASFVDIILNRSQALAKRRCCRQERGAKRQDLSEGRKRALNPLHPRAFPDNSSSLEINTIFPAQPSAPTHARSNVQADSSP